MSFLPTRWHPPSAAAGAWMALTGPQGIGKSAMACMAAAWLLRENDSQPSLVETWEVVDPQNPGSNLVYEDTIRTCWLSGPRSRTTSPPDQA